MAVDPKAAGEEGGNYYIVQWKSAPYALAADEVIDGVKCMAGEKIVLARHTNLAFSANSKPRWYTPNPIDVRVPAKLVLHVGFAMPPAVKEKMSSQKSKQQTAALAQGARVLSEEDHELIMEELHARDMGEDEE